MKYPHRKFANLIVLLLAAHTAYADVDADDWFSDDEFESVPQAVKGELIFLSGEPDSDVLHSVNRLTITRNSLVDGWVELEQCYSNLDPVPEAEVVYRYRNLRNLRIGAHNNIDQAFVKDASVQLVDVKRNATLCVLAGVQILYQQPDGGFVMRNGPFYRGFLDGYFPFHVTLDISYPQQLLSFKNTHPAPQAGFEVTHARGSVRIDARFAGTLKTEIRFNKK